MRKILYLLVTLLHMVESLLTAGALKLWADGTCIEIRYSAVFTEVVAEQKVGRVEHVTAVKALRGGFGCSVCQSPSKQTILCEYLLRAVFSLFSPGIL